jgi:hypothetical protein
MYPAGGAAACPPVSQSPPESMPLPAVGQGIAHGVSRPTVACLHAQSSTDDVTASWAAARREKPWSPQRVCVRSHSCLHCHQPWQPL